METTGTNSQSPASSAMSTSSPSSGYKVNYKYEGGRRFQDIENVNYFVPNDNEEMDRLHHQHWMIKAIMGGNYQSPIEDKLKEGVIVLDSGCGPGTWGLDMAEAYPNSTFYGIDAAPVFPSEVKPKNCHFELANVAERLPYPDNYFDYVHQRFLIFGLTRSAWETAINELVRVLKPGGYLEINECNFTFDPCGPKLKRMDNALIAALSSRGMIPCLGNELGPNFLGKRNDLVDINCRVEHFPVNHHGKIGELFWDDVRQGAESMHVFIVKECPELADPEYYQRYINECAEECKEYEPLFAYFSYTMQKKVEPAS